MADVPFKYDLTISDGTDTHGYVLYAPWSGGDSSNAPQKAIHSYSPTFVPRQNVQGNYGDDSEDYFMTFSQKNWSDGELQRHVPSEGQGTARYWAGTKVDVRTVGQVKIRPDVRSVDVGTQNVIAVTGFNAVVFAAATDNLYEIGSDGSSTDRGAHGLTGDPASKWAIASDGTDVYITDSDTGDVRKWNGAAFSTFSTDGANALLYHNNSLYGTAAGNLYTWSTAGVRSTLFTWKDVDGTALSFAVTDVGLVSYGGKVFIGIDRLGGFPGSGWIYDGVGTSKIWEYPGNFLQRNIAVHDGIIFVGGSFFQGSSLYRPAIIYYANGTTNLLWRGDTTSAAPGTALVSLDTGLLFTDHASDKFMWYDSARGGIHSIGAFTDNNVGDNSKLAVCESFALLSQQDDVLFQFPHSTSTATSATVTLSLVDFDSSQSKLFRGIKIEYDEATDGDGGSVDIAYRLEDADGSYTNLQTGAVSGTEYSIGVVGTPITGRSISIRLTLNKGTSTLGPVLKRVYVRAAPQVTQRHRGLYHIDCTAPNSGTHGTPDHTGTLLNRSGMDMVHELRDFADAGSLLTITDPLHDFTGIIELLEITQVSANEDPGYVVTLGVREV